VNRKRNALVLLILFIAYVAVRWRLLVNPGMTFDLVLYKEWLWSVTKFGIAEIYSTSKMDYPPLYAYILKPFGWIYMFMMARGLTGPVASTVLIKLPPLVFDLGIACLLWRCMALAGKGVTARAVAAAAYLFNPAALFLTAYWGLPDSIHAFFILASFATIGYGMRFWFPSYSVAASRSTAAIVLAWSCLTLAALMKPLGLPYFPLLLFFTWILCRFRAAVLGMTAAVIVGLLVFAPFLAHGDAVEVLKRVLTDVGAMPFTSSNAHNFWWLIGAWYYSEAPWIGPLTPTQIGLILFGLSYFALCWKARRQYISQNREISPLQVLAIAAMVSFSFFVFSTHLHEHHLFATVPLLASFALPSRAWRNVFLCVSLGVFVNCWLHDIPMDQPQWPYTIGGATNIAHPPRFDRPYYVAELVAIWSSVALNLATYTIAMAGVLWPGKRNWLARLYPSANGGEPAQTSSPQGEEIGQSTEPCS
jgi:Gpi18-like mannosyltransferase